MIGMLGHTFVAFADNVMVGQLGTAELAAVSLGNSFIFIAMSLGIGFTTAITPLVAEADSSNNIVEGKKAFKHGLVLLYLSNLTIFGYISSLSRFIYSWNLVCLICCSISSFTLSRVGGVVSLESSRNITCHPNSV